MLEAEVNERNASNSIWTARSDWDRRSRQTAAGTLSNQRSGLAFLPEFLLSSLSNSIRSASPDSTWMDETHHQRINKCKSSGLRWCFMVVCFIFVLHFSPRSLSPPVQLFDVCFTAEHRRVFHIPYVYFKLHDFISILHAHMKQQVIKCMIFHTFSSITNLFLLVKKHCCFILLCNYDLRCLCIHIL